MACNVKWVWHPWSRVYSWCWTCIWYSLELSVWSPNRCQIWSLMFIEDVTVDRSSRMNCKVFRAMLSAHIHTNAAELIKQNFTKQMGNNPKQTAKTTQELLVVNMRLHFIVSNMESVNMAARYLCHCMFDFHRASLCVCTQVCVWERETCHQHHQLTGHCLIIKALYWY